MTSIYPVTPVFPYTHRRSLTMYLEAVIERVCRCNWRPRLSEFRDALGGRDRASLEMHWEAVIERVSTCTWRPGLSELKDALRRCNRASLAMHMQAMIEMGGVLGGGPFGGRRDGS